MSSQPHASRTEQNRIPQASGSKYSESARASEKDSTDPFTARHIALSGKHHCAWGILLHHFLPFSNRSDSTSHLLGCHQNGRCWTRNCRIRHQIEPCLPRSNRKPQGTHTPLGPHRKKQCFLRVCHIFPRGTEAIRRRAYFRDRNLQILRDSLRVGLLIRNVHLRY
jgi:hypothetical protein